MKKLLGLVAAAAAGYATGLLFAPKSGKETRSDIKSKLDNLKETTSEKMDSAKDVYDESVAKVKKGAGEISNEMTIIAQEAQTSAGQISKEAKRFGGEAKKHLGKASNSAARTTKEVGRSIGKLK